MQRPLVVTSTLLFALSLCGTADAQGFLYSPPFLASSEGHDLVPLFGYRPVMRYQMVDGELRGNRVSLKEVALRLNGTTGQSPWLAQGRTWSSVVLRIADGDRASFGTDFGKNMTSTPSVVFNGSVAWPSVKSPLAIKPAPWGGTTGAYRFPFGSPWLYGGTTDVVTDCTFQGGKLMNGIAWGKFTPNYYHFDGFGSPSSVAVSNVRGIPDTRLNNNSPGVTTRCNDSAWGIHNGGAYLFGGGSVYGSAPSNPALKDKVVFRSKSWLTAPNATAIHGWGFATSEAGVPIGTGCNRLHVVGSLVLHAVTASTGGFSETPDLVIPWQTNYANGRITMQAAWSDSTRGTIALTQALELQLPGHAPPNRLAKRSSIYESDATSVQGPFTTGNHNPGLRYAH